MPDDTLKKLTIPESLSRAAVLAMDGEEKNLRISISSDTPYLRWDWNSGEEYYEVLDHSPGGFRDERLKAGLPMLFNHNRGVHLGRARAFDSDGKRITVSDIVWSETDLAKEKKIDMEKGVLVDTSVGYSLLGEGECVGAKDGKPIYRFAWEPHEFSLVTIPADISVGAGREANADVKTREISIRSKITIDDNPNTLHNATNQTRHMPEATLETKPEVTIDVVREREEAAKAARDGYKANAKKIREWADEGIKANPAWKPALEKVVTKHLDGDADYAAFTAEAVLTFPGARKLDERDPNADLGLSKRDRKQFSLARAILQANSREGLQGHEKAVCEAAASQLHGKDSRQWSGLCIPDDMLRANFAEDNDLDATGVRNMAELAIRMAAAQGRSLNASVFSQGGALVGTDLLGGSMIDILRNAVLIGNGPLAITELGGLVNNIAIPKQSGTSTVYWLAEGAEITASQQAFAQLVLSPKRMGVVTGYTKQLLAQASLSVEMFVRSDQALTMAVEEDRVTLYGTGAAGEPLGIFNTTGTLANVTFGGAATWADMVALEYGLENANVRTGQQAILTSPLTKSYLKQTPTVAASTFPIFLWGRNEGGQFPVIGGVMPGIVNEYPAYATKQVSTNVMVQGVFQNVIKGRWAGFDVVVDPFTSAASETIRVIVNQWLDIGLRYPQSFNITTDAPTAP